MRFRTGKASLIPENNSPGSPCVSSTTGALALGNGAARFKGGLDELALYRTALTPTQVSSHFMAAG